MKKLMVCMLFAGVAIQASACSLEVISVSFKANKALDKIGAGFRNYEALCRKFNAANAVLRVTGDATVINGNAIAWASVGVQDKKSLIFSDAYTMSSTHYDPSSGISRAEDMLVEAILGAVESSNFDRTLADLNKSRATVKQSK